MNLITREERKKHYDKMKYDFPKFAYEQISVDSNEIFPQIKSTFDESTYDAFMIKVKGHSMKDAGINHGDTLIVKRNVKPDIGKIIVAEINGKLAVKRLHSDKNKIFLVSDNKDYAPIQVLKQDAFKVWGTVSMVIKSK